MQLPKYNNCVLDLRFFLGSFRDYSGNNNHGTPTGVHFEKRPDKHVRFSGSDVITVSDSSELQLTEGTIIVYGDFDNYYDDYKRLVSKRNASGTNYDFYLKDSTFIGLYTDAQEVANISWQGSKSVGVSFSDGEKAKAYKDGAFISDFADTSTISTDDSDIYIGNYHVASDAYALKNPLKGVLIYNTVLTDEEIALVHAWIVNNTKTPSYPKRNFKYPSQITGKENGLVAAYDMKNVHGEIIDKTGNGNTLDITGAVQAPTVGGLPSMEMYGNANSKIVGAANAGLNAYANVTFSFLFRYDVADKYLLTYGPVNDSISYGTNASNQFVVSDDIDNGNDIFAGSTTLTAGNVYHAICEVHSDGTKKVYIDNVEEVNNSTNSTNLTDGTDAPLTIGQRYSSAFWTGNIAGLEIFNKILSAGEREALYNKYAKLPYFVDDLADANESVAANSGAGNYLENTNWIINAGQWKISRDSTKDKVIECDISGILYQESQQAYGTWEFDLYKGADGNTSFVNFICSKPDRQDSENDGYIFYINNTEWIEVGRTTNGATTSRIRSSNSYVDNETWYKIRITRRYDGQFSLYIKGGDFDDWTLSDSSQSGSNPIIDNTHTESKYLVLELDTGDKIANFKFSNGVLTP